MKILIYAHLFPPSKGGMQYQNLAFAQGLKSLGHDVEVVACNNKGARRFVADLNFPVHILPKWPFAPMHSLSGISRLNWIFTPYYFIKIKKILRDYRPQVVFLADETSNFFWGFGARWCQIPYVSYCSVPHLALCRRRYKSMFSNGLGGITPFVIHKMLNISYTDSKLLLAVSHSTKEELCKEAPGLACKIRIVPNSIDDRFFNMEYSPAKVRQLKNRLGISKDHFVLLSVTRLTVDKGVDDVIKALSGLKSSTLSRLRYVVVGEGSALDYLRKLAKNLDLDKHVIFTGGISHLELIPYYDMCDLFVLPPRRGPHESFGRVFVEAAARSKPSIGAKEGGMLDVIDDGQTGILVYPGDIDMIRAKIVYLMNNLDKLNRLGVKARLKAERMYTSRGVALQFERHLKSIVEQHLHTTQDS
jgi:glycosyltransferase involved in cell wall biosynthesis